MSDEAKNMEQTASDVEGTDKQVSDSESAPSKKGGNPPPKSIIIAAICSVTVIAIFAIAFRFITTSFKEQDPDIITIATLERIVNVSTLSTFTAVYNGIAEVPSVDDPDKIDYYVSYEARINAGIDFDRISFDIDKEQMLIRASIPQVYITDVRVEIASLDYIFINKDRDTLSVSTDAYRACEADALAESAKQSAILTLAKENAENILEALIMPFVNQLDASYRLVIDWED